MARRRRRKSDLNASDFYFMLPTKVGAIIAMIFGLVGVGLYHFLEPVRGDPTNPVTMMGHIYWETIAAFVYWPFLGLFCIGLVGFAFSAIREAFTKRSM